MISVMCEIVDNINEKIYAFGRVYRLVSSNGLCYVGSTVQTLSQRLREHKCNSKKNGVISSKQLFVDDALHYDSSVCEQKFC